MGYTIFRYYFDETKQAKIIKENVSLEEAQEHCNNPETKETGVYFDGYTKQTNY